MILGVRFFKIGTHILALDIFDLTSKHPISESYETSELLEEY
jgi:hypothetical protein